MFLPEVLPMEDRPVWSPSVDRRSWPVEPTLRPQTVVLPTWPDFVFLSDFCPHSVTLIVRKSSRWGVGPPSLPYVSGSSREVHLLCGNWNRCKTSPFHCHICSSGDLFLIEKNWCQTLSEFSDMNSITLKRKMGFYLFQEYFIKKFNSGKNNY